MYLPGEIHERIKDLRLNKGLSQKDLCNITGIVPSQLSRIENGKIDDISNDTLIKLSKAFGVSTDYILGLTTISLTKSYDISALGLSDGAVKAIMSGVADIQILNRIIEHKNFLYLQQVINTYIHNTAVFGVRARNEMIDIVTSTLGDYMKAHPEQRKSIQKDIRHMKSEKLAEHEAELDKIKATFLAILKDVKADIDAGEPPCDAATEMIMQEMQECARLVAQSPHKYKADDVANMVVEMVKRATPLDEQSSGLLEQLAGYLFTGQGGKIE